MENPNMSDATTAKKPGPKRRLGRPRGKKTEPAPVVEVELSKCPTCASTKRSNYANTRTLEYGSVIEGRECSKVVWRNCWCLECGQHRIDKSYE